MLLEKTTKFFLFISLAVPLLIRADSLIYPFTSGKVYLFRFLVLICFFLWIFLIIKKPEYRPDFRNLLIISLILFLFGLIITGFLGVDPVQSFFSNFERGDGIIQFSFFVLYFLMLTSVLKKKKDWQMLLGLFLSVIFFLSLYSWFNYEKFDRISGIFGNSAYMAASLIISIGFLGVILKESFSERFSFWSKKSSKYFLFFIILIFLLTLFYTKTRGAYFGLAGGFFLFTILSILFLRKEKKKLILFSIVILTIGLIFVSSIFIFKETKFIKKTPVFSRIVDLSEFWQLSSVRERFLVWNIAIKGFQDRPLFGWGPENFGPVFNKYYDYHAGLNAPWFDKSHNQFLEILTTGGIFLFSLYLFWIFSVFYLISKIFKKKKLLAIILSSTYFAYLIQGLFLFDTFPLYLVLFTFLAFVYFEYQSIYPSKMLDVSENERRSRNYNHLNRNKYILITVGFFVVVFIAISGVTAAPSFLASAAALNPTS